MADSLILCQLKFKVQQNIIFHIISVHTHTRAQNMNFETFMHADVAYNIA